MASEGAGGLTGGPGGLTGGPGGLTGGLEGGTDVLTGGLTGGLEGGTDLTGVPGGLTGGLEGGTGLTGGLTGGLEGTGGSEELNDIPPYAEPVYPIEAQQASSFSQELTSFFYNPSQDYQFYSIVVLLIPYVEFLSSVSNDQLSSSFNCLTSTDHVFYFQHPNEWKHYRVTCKLFLHQHVAQMLNNNSTIIHHGGQMQQEFTLNHKINLEKNLRKSLADHFRG